MAGKCDLYIDINSDFEVLFELYNDNQTAMELDEYEALLIFDGCSIESTLTVEGNSIRAVISASATKELEASAIAYNLVLEAEGKRHRVLEGKAHLSEEVSCAS